MKALYFKPGEGTSKHFHCSKHESFFVSRGIIIVTLYNKEVKNNKIRLSVGDSFVVPPGLVHSICNGGDQEACLIEASTFSQDSDSNRLDK
jgi:mannose-6-phosphate isomerase-like protein (cupin superfamily)